jgi:hypothetical protein
MKPTPQITPSGHASRRFPSTDYSFHETVETLEAPAKTSAPVSTRKPLPLYKLRSEFLNAEASRANFAEASLFSLITAVCAWPIASALVAMVRMARNY